MTMPAKDIYHDCVKIALIKDGSSDVKDDPCDASASGGNSWIAPTPHLLLSLSSSVIRVINSWIAPTPYSCPLTHPTDTDIPLPANVKKTLQ